MTADVLLRFVACVQVITLPPPAQTTALLEGTLGRKKCAHCLHSNLHEAKTCASNHGAIETKVCPTYMRQVYSLRSFITYDS